MPWTGTRCSSQGSEDRWLEGVTVTYTVVKSSFPGFDALRAHGLAATLHHLSSIGGQPEPVRILDRGVAYVVDPEALSDAGVEAAFSAPRLRWIREWHGLFSDEVLGILGATTRHPRRDEVTGEELALPEHIYRRLQSQPLIKDVLRRYSGSGTPLQFSQSSGETIVGLLDTTASMSARGSAYARAEKKTNVKVPEPDWILGILGRLIGTAVSFAAVTGGGRRYTFITGVPLDYSYHSRSMSGLGIPWQVGRLPATLQGAHYLVSSLYAWTGGAVPFSGYTIESWFVSGTTSRAEFGRTLRCYAPLAEYPDDMLRLQDQIDQAGRQNDAGDDLANAVADFLWNPSVQALRQLAFEALRENARASQGRRPLMFSERFAKEAVRLRPMEGKRLQDLYESAAVLECGRLLRNVFSNRVRSPRGESPDYEFLTDLESTATPGDLASALERALHRAVTATGSRAWVPSEQRIGELMRLADRYGAQQVATAIALFGLTFAKRTNGEADSASEATSDAEEREGVAE